MSPRSDIFDIAADYYTTGPEMYMLDESLSKLTPQDMVPLYSESSFSMQPCDFVHTAQGFLDFGYESQPQGMIDSVLTACSPLDIDPYIMSLSNDATPMVGIGLLNDNESSLLVAREPSPIGMFPKDAPRIGPTEAETSASSLLLASATDNVLSIPISHRVSVTRAYRPFLNLDV
jgi:hypothetical protein